MRVSRSPLLVRGAKRRVVPALRRVEGADRDRSPICSSRIIVPSRPRRVTRYPNELALGQSVSRAGFGAVGAGRGRDVPGQSHRRALDLVAGAILERVPFIAMTGNKGVGKTTVLEAAIARLAEQPVRFIRVGNPLATPLTLGRMLIQIANSGHGDPDENDEKRALIALRARRAAKSKWCLSSKKPTHCDPRRSPFSNC